MVGIGDFALQFVLTLHRSETDDANVGRKENAVFSNLYCMSGSCVFCVRADIGNYIESRRFWKYGLVSNIQIIEATPKGVTPKILKQSRRKFFIVIKYD